MSRLRRSSPRSSERGPRSGPADPAVAVVSPFADEDDVRTTPTWFERLRGLVGMGVVVVVSGVLLALLIAALLVGFAVVVFTTFN